MLMISPELLRAEVEVCFKFNYKAIMRAVGKDEKLLQILLPEYKETIKLGFTAIL